MHLTTTLQEFLSRTAKPKFPKWPQLSRACASDTIRIPLDLALGLLCGSTLAYLAWTALPTPSLAALLPLALALCLSRAQACSIGFAYVATVLRFNPTEIISSNSSLSVGATAVLGGVVWSLAWTANISPYRKALASVLAWGTALLPPVVLLVPRHPVVVWGQPTTQPAQKVLRLGDRLNGKNEAPKLNSLSKKELQMQSLDPLLIWMGIVGALALFGSFWVKNKTLALEKTLLARRGMPMKVRAIQRSCRKPPA